MNCKYVSKVLSEYVDGNLTEAEAGEIESHVQGCEACAAELEATENLVASLAGLGRLRSPVDSWSGVQARIVAMDTAHTQWWRWVLRPVVAAPAAAAIALLALYVIWPAGERTDAKLDRALASEYSHYISAHSDLQRRQMFVDPDAVFVKAELQKASLSTGAELE